MGVESVHGFFDPGFVRMSVGEPCSDPVVNRVFWEAEVGSPWAIGCFLIHEVNGDRAVAFRVLGTYMKDTRPRTGAENAYDTWYPSMTCDLRRRFIFHRSPATGNWIRQRGGSLSTFGERGTLRFVKEVKV